MKNAEVLRMAKAMLTPAVETDTSTDSDPTPDDGSTDDPIGSVGGNGAVTLALTPSYTEVIPTFSLSDPYVLERLLVLLETAVRLLYPKGLLSRQELPLPVYPLVEEDEFPLPDGLASAAACLAAWMLTGESKLRTAYESALDGYLATLEAVMSPIVNKYR